MESGPKLSACCHSQPPVHAQHPYDHALARRVSADDNFRTVHDCMLHNPAYMVHSIVIAMYVLKLAAGQTGMQQLCSGTRWDFVNLSDQKPSAVKHENISRPWHYLKASKTMSH